MATALNIPGVYLRERLARDTRALSTGVPIFVGLLQDSAAMPRGSADDADSYGPVALHHKAEFLGGAAKFLGHAIDGFFDNGGAYCYVVAIKVPSTDDTAVSRLVAAMELTVGLDDADLVAIPDAMALSSEDRVLQVQRAMIQHCTTFGTRIAILDGLRHKPAPQLIADQVKQLAVPLSGPVNAALYYPWISTVASELQFVPPSGQVCGIIARTDADAGVFQAPANAEVRDATDVEDDFDAESLAALHAAGVNCIRAFPARGIRVWGARSLSPDPQWRYLNVRRLVLTVRRWIDTNLAWAAFEPNVPALWARIQRELTTYLMQLWRDGALQGAVASDAFFIRCDAELNPPQTREIGQAITEIGLAPSVPAEFVVVTVQHRAGTTELT